MIGALVNTIFWLVESQDIKLSRVVSKPVNDQESTVPPEKSVDKSLNDTLSIAPVKPLVSSGLNTILLA